jgi:hypothetical protein
MKRFRQAKHTNWKNQDKKGIVLDLNTGRYYTLNETGLLVWELFQSTKTIGDVSMNIGRCFGVAPENIHEDIEKFVQIMIEDEILEEVTLGLVETNDSKIEVSGNSSYVSPEIEKHEAIKDITAGSGGTYYYSHYWYPN